MCLPPPPPVNLYLPPAVNFYRDYRIRGNHGKTVLPAVTKNLPAAAAAAIKFEGMLWNAVIAVKICCRRQYHLRRNNCGNNGLPAAPLANTCNSVLYSPYADQILHNVDLKQTNQILICNCTYWFALPHDLSTYCYCRLHLYVRTIRMDVHDWVLLPRAEVFQG